MKNYILIIVMIFTSCTSFSFPVPEDGEGTLLVILQENLFINEITSQPKGNYSLKIFDAENDKLVEYADLSNEGNYILISNLPEGTYYIGGYSYRARNKIGRFNSKVFAHRPLIELRNGEITFSTRVFGTTYEQRGSRIIMYLRNHERDVQAITENVYNELLTTYPDKIHLWSIQYRTED